MLLLYLVNEYSCREGTRLSIYGIVPIVPSCEAVSVNHASKQGLMPVHDPFFILVGGR